MLGDVFGDDILRRKVDGSDKIAFVDDGRAKSRMIEASNGKESSWVGCRYVEVANTKRSSIGVFDGRKQADGTRIVIVERSVIVEKVAVSGDSGEGSSVNLSTCDG